MKHDFCVNTLAHEVIEARSEDDVAILDDEVGSADAFAAYFAEGERGGVPRGIVLSPELGLAIEELREGVTLQQLWNDL